MPRKSFTAEQVIAKLRQVHIDGQQDHWRDHIRILAVTTETYVLMCGISELDVHPLHSHVHYPGEF
jgi:hypothetical protein